MTEARHKLSVSFVVNGQPRSVEAWPLARLLDVLRDDLGLMGTKEGCGEGECGACTVLVDGVLVNSCLVPIAQMQGASVVTIEAIAADPELQHIQAAFHEGGGVQCGICTPGMILATAELLGHTPRPTLDETRQALAGNLCRCTGYTRIFESVQDAAERVGRARGGASR